MRKLLESKVNAEEEKHRRKKQDLVIDETEEEARGKSVCGTHCSFQFCSLNTCEDALLLEDVVVCCVFKCQFCTGDLVTVHC